MTGFRFRIRGLPHRGNGLRGIALRTAPDGCPHPVCRRNQVDHALRRARLAVAEAVKETAEDAAFAGKGGAGRRRDGALTGNGLVVVGAGDGVNDLGLVEILRAIDLGHVADEHAVAHDLRFEAGRAVGVPLGFAAAGQRHPDAEPPDAAAEQVSVDATVTKGVDHPPGPELVHARKVAFVPETPLNVS